MKKKKNNMQYCLQNVENVVYLNHGKEISFHNPKLREEHT